jgi:hypothetical protein
MKLTREQWAEVERQRRGDPDGRIMLEFTPEQEEEYRRMVEVEETGRDANIAYARKLLAASREPGFSGDLRRAIGASRRDHRELARDIGIDVEALEAFRAGDAALPSDVVDRLVALLGLKLVPMTNA